MYRCARCKEPVMNDPKSIGLQCKNCNCKIFFKDRPPIKQTLYSD